jgi:hypothetical protein
MNDEQRYLVPARSAESEQGLERTTCMNDALGRLRSECDVEKRRNSGAVLILICYGPALDSLISRSCRP